MNFQVALVREQGVEFAVIPVQSHVMSSESSRSEAAAGFQAVFPDAEIVLMVQGSGGRARFWGRTDIVRFLTRVSVHALPWRRVDVS